VIYKFGNTFLPAFLLLFFAFGNLSCQETDYKILFGKNWTRAETIVSENEAWIKEKASKFLVDYRVAVSVVFPELVRYSALRDKIETAMLKTLYINLGDEYADFSVGQFQMKPSFAEDINKNIWLIRDRRLKRLFRKPSSFDNIRQYRSSVVGDLESLERQFDYLMAFLKICEHEYPLNMMTEEERVKFIATAYNCGLLKGEDYIRSMSGKKFFSTKLVPSETYSYPEISLFWYRSYGR